MCRESVKYWPGDKIKQVLCISRNKSPTETILNKTDHSTDSKIRLKLVYVGGLINVEENRSR